MSIDEALAKLSAGLDRDEMIASAALEALRKDQDFSEDWAWYRPKDWIGGLVNRAGYRSWGETTPESVHITNCSPQDKIREVEAIRKIITEYRRVKEAPPEEVPDEEYEAWMAFRLHALEDMIRVLAGIYTDPEPDGTTE